MQYAARRGAKVINASWGGAPCVTSLKNTFIALRDAGVLVIVAAGNDGRDVDLYPEFPASFNLSNQITVAAASMSDVMTSWSNSGFTAVHVAAPGESILSTVPNNSTAYMDGTSMAAPFVSGAAALLWSVRPTATAAQIKQAILQSVDVTRGREFKVSTRGRINVEKALTILKQISARPASSGFMRRRVHRRSAKFAFAAPCCEQRQWTPVAQPQGRRSLS